MNIALIGCGAWGKNLARVLYDKRALHTVCDVAKSKLDHYTDVTYRNNYDDVLKDETVDVVVIATPAIYHFDMVMRALETNKHVFVEKPLALSLKEGQFLNALAKTRGKVLFVGHLLHYHPAVVEMKKIVADGVIGDIRYIYSERLNDGAIRKEESILWSFAPHDISVIHALMGGEPSEVEARGECFTNSGVYDVTTTHMAFTENRHASIYVNWLNPTKQQKMTVIGSDGSLVFDDMETQKLILYKDGDSTVMHCYQYEPLIEEVDAFIDACYGAEYFTDGDEAVKVLRTLELASSCLT